MAEHSLWEADVVCFDMDGTLLDLNFRHPEMDDVRRDLRDLFVDYGVERSFSPLLGTLEEALAAVEREHGPSTRDELEQQAQERLTAADVHAANQQAVRRHALPVLTALEARDIPFVVVTNNSRRGSEIALEESGLPSPAGLVTRDDVDQPKPEPEMVSVAVDSVSGTTDRITMVGDRPSDAESAKRAAAGGSFEAETVLVDPTGRDDQSPYVDHRVQSLADLCADGNQHG